MVMMMKLKHVDERSRGRKRFRRRYSGAVALVLGESFFQVATKAREGAALVAEQEFLLAEYDKIVAKVRKMAAGGGQLFSEPQRKTHGPIPASPPKAGYPAQR